MAGGVCVGGVCGGGVCGGGVCVGWGMWGAGCVCVCGGVGRGKGGVYQGGPLFLRRHSPSDPPRRRRSRTQVTPARGTRGQRGAANVTRA